jgi:hypothetical protein
MVASGLLPDDLAQHPLRAVPVELAVEKLANGHAAISYGGGIAKDATLQDRPCRHREPVGPMVSYPERIHIENPVEVTGALDGHAGHHRQLASWNGRRN